MPKPIAKSGSKNLISQNLIALRKKHQLSQRDLSRKLQLAGYDMDKNAITRIELGKRYVSDIEIKALCDLFEVTFEELIAEPHDEHDAHLEETSDPSPEKNEQKEDT